MKQLAFTLLAALLLALPVHAEIGLGGSFVIHKTKDTRFELAPNVIDGGTLVQLTLDRADIKGVRVASDPHALPDGRPIPGVASGTLFLIGPDQQGKNSAFLLFLQKNAMVAMEPFIEASLRNPGVLY
jgi:hypothetical protein